MSRRKKYYDFYDADYAVCEYCGLKLRHTKGVQNSNFFELKLVNEDFKISDL